MPYARRWTAGFDRDVDMHHSILPFRDQLDHMTDDALFIWTPYAAILDGLPAFCRAGQGVWMSRCPLIHLDIVEEHMPERVLRQFGHTQSIPPHVRHELRHYQRDDRAAVDDDFLAFMHVQLHRWENRLDTLAVVGHLTPIQHYMRWYHQITRRLIGNPALRPPGDVGYSALAGQYEALLVAVQRLRMLGLEHMPYPGLAGLAAEMVRIAEDGIRQAGEIRRREEPIPEADYQAAPGGGPGAPRGGGRAGRGRRAAGGRRARRGRGGAPEGTWWWRTPSGR
ncbi:serine/threonine-protein phosphatase 7 long form homolog [Lycium ferocissimum]|uniref:serine/threonine-protein phosphatase 7 long form homolog n=1 Tax=Lycium ferocissimum TaxID=112874 RepID=UPI0028164431|nr:serine/threonine-protein phosphatase 7 long form homolog [Lycium ferocissimum]